MAKAQFYKGQRVWVEKVGAWAVIERIVPVWAKGFDEPVKVTYEVGLGREFLADELQTEQGDLESALELGHWRLLRCRNKWQAIEDCAHLDQRPKLEEFQDHLFLVTQGLAHGIVTGECSSAALWPLAACRRRIVTPFSVLLFHPLKWQSEGHIGLSEAREWARHFGELEQDMDRLLANFLGVGYEQLMTWMSAGAVRLGPRIRRRRIGRTGPLVDAAQA